MKAITYHRYGGPEVLEHAEIERPIPGPGEVLVRVRATSINAADYRLMRADPFLARIASGLFRPNKTPVLGSDVAGVVEQLGEGVTGVEVGDEVLGNSFQTGMGAFAEYVRVRESSLIAKPASLTFEEAAAVPLAAITALQGLRDLAKVQPGESVLVQGAGGGVGTFVVQIAKALGAHVTAVCGTRNIELMIQLGADRVIDYAREDFTKEDKRYDVIVGVNGFHTLAEYKRSLNPGGRYVMLGGTGRGFFDGLFLARFRFMFGDKSASLLTIDESRRAEDLAQIRDMLTSGQLTPVIDRTFPFDQLPEAIRYVEQGHVRGKVAVTVSA